MLDFKRLIDKLRAERSLSAEELRQLIDGYDDETLVYAAAAARAVTEAHFGDGVYLRGLIEVSSRCRNDCRYCGLRRSNRRAERYRLEPEEILAACAAGYRAGLRTFVLQGGEDPALTDALLVPLIAEIHRRWPDCALTLSLGERSDASYEALYAAGATRYLLRHETIDEAHYRLLHPDDMSLARRLACLDALRRIGGAEIPVEEILGSQAVDGYRNKSQFPVSPEGRAGFYRARSHDVVPAADCRLQAEQANAVARAVEEYLREEGVPAYDERTRRGLLRHIYVRTSREGRALVCLVVNGEALPREAALVERIRAACPETVGVVLNTNDRDTNVVLGERYRTLWGEDTLTDTLCGLRFRLSVPSFYQVNRAQAERLYEKAVEFAGLTGRETALDLYCGAGTITLVMARQAGQAVGAEIVAAAVENAEENARLNGVENVRFLLGDAGEAAARLAAEALRPQVVVVDPPRKGLGEEVIAAVAAMGPERVVYVSCDPGTLGRDVRRFAEAGYRAARAAAVDLFPRTRHVETVVLLQRGAL